MEVFNFKRYIPGGMNVRIDGYVMRKDNRKGHEGEWLYSYGRPDTSGHLYVDYLGSKYYVHRMVAELFIPIPPKLLDNPKLAVHHMDEVKTNNSAENLEWIDFGDHSRLHKQGEAHHNTSLTATQVAAIRDQKGKRPVQAVAKQYDLSTKAIHDIWSGRTWKHLTPENDGSSPDS